MERRLDYLMNGPLPSLQSVLSERSQAGAARWRRQFHLRKDGASLQEVLLLAVQTGDVNATGPPPRCTTCLHEAVGLQLEDMVHELLEAGASLEACDARGHTAFDRAHKVHNQACVDMLRRARSARKGAYMLSAMEFIGKVPLFKRIHPEEYPIVASALVAREYSPGDCVIRQGDVGEDILIIEKGEALVEVLKPGAEKPQEVGRLGPCESFGEAAVLLKAPRNATVRAVTRLAVRVLSLEAVARLGLAPKLKFKHFRLRDKVVATRSNGQAEGEGRKPCCPEEWGFIMQAVKDNASLGPRIADLSPESLEEMAKSARRLEVEPGHDVVVQGDLKADHFFVIARGTFEVLVNGECIAYLKPGGSFGDMALMFRAPRNATVRATAEARQAVLWSIHRDQLQRLKQAEVLQKLRLYARMLGQCELFREASEEKQVKVADALVEMTFFRGEEIIRQGDVGKTFYLLFRGEVTVQNNGKEVARLASALESSTVAELLQCAELPDVAFFGERALLVDEPRVATVRAVSERVVVLGMTREAFRVLRPGAEPIRELQAEAELGDPDDFDPELSKVFEAASDNSGDEEGERLVGYELSKLKHVGVLGAGGFGVVSLVECGVTGQRLALKALCKGHIVEEAQEQCVMNEKWVMRITHSPFVIRLAATFNAQEQLYFLMEAALGGSLYAAYSKELLWGCEVHARFYMACVLRAFEHLHKLHILYRDLKPENLLLDEKGYCKVADFGLSKIAMGHTYTTCGTPEYFAPEMVNLLGHTNAVDWWTFGVLLYELISSEMPFPGEEPMEIFDNVLKGIEAVHFKEPDAAWAALVRELCRQVPSERLPMRPGRIQNLEQHPFFLEAGFNWEALSCLAMPAPFVPAAALRLPKEAADAQADVEYVDPNNGWDLDFEDPMGPADLKVFPESSMEACMTTADRGQASRRSRVTKQNSKERCASFSDERPSVAAPEEQVPAAPAAPASAPAPAPAPERPQAQGPPTAVEQAPAALVPPPEVTEQPAGVRAIREQASAEPSPAPEAKHLAGERGPAKQESGAPLLVCRRSTVPRQRASLVDLSKVPAGQAHSMALVLPGPRPRPALQAWVSPSPSAGLSRNVSLSGVGKVPQVRTVSYVGTAHAARGLLPVNRRTIVPPLISSTRTCADNRPWR